MTAAALESPRFDMGRVVSRTFGVIGRNLAVFLLLSVLLAGIPDLLANSSRIFFGGATSIQTGLLQLLGGVLRLVGIYVLQSALVHGTIVDLNGRKASFGDCLSTGLRFFLPVLGIAILTGVAVVVGLILLIVPGVMMAVAWAVNVPVEVVERTSVLAAFSRSADLTRGHRWAIFGLVLIFLLVSWIVTLVTLAVTGGLTFAGGGFSSAALVVVTAIGVLESLVAAAGVASIYYELRSIKEGVGAEALAAVFD